MAQTPLTSELLDDFFAALAPRVSAGGLRTDAMTRGLYSTDASMYQVMPVGVLVPRHLEDVQAALETAYRFRVPVLPRGGGSSLAGQAVGEALVIDFSHHLGAMLEVNREEAWVRVQPGLVLDHLNAVVRPYNLMVGPDPASSNRATLGGMVANNATGTHSILYGNTINHIRAARVLLDDGTPTDVGPLDASAWAERQRRGGREGEIYTHLEALLAANADIIRRDTPRHWRRSNGYRLEYLLDPDTRNMAQLLCGSEGTLAVATELTIGLVSRPRQTALGVVHFTTRRTALQAVTTILETDPSAVELFDGVTISQCRKSPGFAHQLTFIEGEPGGVLITEYYGETPQELAARLDALEQRLVGHGLGYACVRAVTPEQVQNVWSVRKAALGLIMAMPGDRKPLAFIEDAAVPVAHLADYIEDLSQLLEETQTEAAMYAHASGGCLHVRPFINTKVPAEVVKMQELSAGSMALVRKYGGVTSSEHGDGLARSWLNEGLLGTDLYNANRYLKSLFDPRGLLNPGKVVDAPPMTENLRLGPDYNTLPILAEQDFSVEGGFSAAIEMCNGNGACRKLDSGTMCPPFMVTREERDSTRGRANALRLALSSPEARDALTADGLYGVMDLCIQCKACKTECPSNVDMAKVKTEWLNLYWQREPVPLRTRLFAHLPRISRYMAGPLAPFVNWLNGLRLTRAVLEQTLGITAFRRPPSFAANTFRMWFRRRRWSKEGPTVVLFVDTFHNYHHTQAAKAAAEFFRLAGYHVEVPRARLCCGRTYLSKGFIDEAQQQALHTLEHLYPYVEAGYPIVGLEPSCILTLEDEFLSLLPGDPRVERLAAAVMTFEEFVVAEAEEGRLDQVAWTDDERQVLLHGHCHQKALVGTGPAERCLALPPGYTVQTIDSGCCGMAGAFGYEQEHLALSLAMAEQRLMPALREASEDTLIAAAGTSCRAQIDDVIGRKALHPAEILRAAMA